MSLRLIGARKPQSRWKTFANKLRNRGAVGWLFPGEREKMTDHEYMDLWFCRLERSLVRIELQLQRVLQLERRELMNLEELKQEVAASTEVQESAILLLDRIGQFLIDHAADPEKIAEMGASIVAEKTSLAASVARNTPADPPPTP